MQGPSDSENSNVKGSLEREEKHGNILPYTADLIPILFQKLSTPRNAMDDRKRTGLHSVDNRIFMYYAGGSIDRRSSVRVSSTVKGTRSHYSFRAVPTPSGDVVMRDQAYMSFLSCACDMHMSFDVRAGGTMFDPRMHMNYIRMYDLLCQTSGVRFARW